MPRIQPGLVSITFRALAPPEIVRLVADAGLKGIEWGGDVHVPHGDLRRAEAVGQMTRSAGLAVASFGSYYRFAECDDFAGAAEPDAAEVLDTAEALGSPAVRLWAGTTSPEAAPPGYRERVIERARALADDARKRGLRLDFEFHEDTLTETPASTVDLLRSIDRPEVRTLWQPPLQTPPDERLAGLRQVLPWVSNIHCNHFGQDPWPHVHPLAEGTDEWGAYLRALAADDVERWILIEHVKNHEAASFREDAATLLEWLREESA